MNKKIMLICVTIISCGFLSGCASVKTYSQVLYKDKGFTRGKGLKVAVFPAFARSGVRYAKRKVETILKYYLLDNKKKLGWKMMYPDKVKQKILNVGADDLYLVIYHKYNALSHFVTRDLKAIGNKISSDRILIPEMVQESIKSGPYWISRQGSNLSLTKLYDDFYVRLVLHVFDVKKGKFIYRIRSVGKVKKAFFSKNNTEENLGKGYAAAIETMVDSVIKKKR